jgi:hypothetical protein
MREEEAAAERRRGKRMNITTAKPSPERIATPHAAVSHAHHNSE